MTAPCPVCTGWPCGCRWTWRRDLVTLTYSLQHGSNPEHMLRLSGHEMLDTAPCGHSRAPIEWVAAVARYAHPPED